MSDSRRLEAHFSSEASFQKVRVAQLEEALRGTEKAVEVSVRRKAEVEGLLVAQQRASRAKEDQISGLRDDVGAAAASADRSNIALDVSRASESRLGARVLQLEKEVASHVEMAQSLTRIEVGLSQHAQQESAMANLERELLQRANEAARKELQVLVLVHMRCYDHHTTTTTTAAAAVTNINITTHPHTRTHTRTHRTRTSSPSSCCAASKTTPGPVERGRRSWQRTWTP